MTAYGRCNLNRRALGMLCTDLELLHPRQIRSRSLAPTFPEPSEGDPKRPGVGSRQPTSLSGVRIGAAEECANLSRDLHVVRQLTQICTVRLDDSQLTVTPQQRHVGCRGRSDVAFVDHEAAAGSNLGQVVRH